MPFQILVFRFQCSVFSKDSLLNTETRILINGEINSNENSN